VGNTRDCRSALLASRSRYRYPCLRTAPHVRVVRPVGRAVVPVGGSLVSVGWRVVPVVSVVRIDGSAEPEQEAVVPESVEVMVPVEAVVAVEPTVPESPTWVIAPGAVTAASSCLAGRVNRKHDRQCGDRHKHHLFRTSQLVHGDTSLSPPTPWDGVASPGIHVAATQLPAPAALLSRAMQFCAG